VLRYGGSPFIYPIYGLGGLPEGFSRLAAIHRGTYMLNKPVDGFEFGPDGKVCGVRSGDEVAKAPMVICDPSYADPAKTKLLGQVIRTICILGAPIPEMLNKDGEPANSGQIIIPQKQLNRNNDIYIMMTSWAHCIAAKGKYVAIVSTVAETADPSKEIEPALALLGPILETFVQISEIRQPVDDGSQDQVFVSSTYDPTSHFEEASTEVLQMWKTITGTDLDLTDLPEQED
jgi:Rab GDP dissociation inhibitor